MAYWLALNDLGATEQSIILGLKGRREKVILLCTEYGCFISHLGRIPCHDDRSSCTVKLNMTNNTMICIASHHHTLHPPTLTHLRSTSSTNHLQYLWLWVLLEHASHIVHCGLDNHQVGWKIDLEERRRKETQSWWCMCCSKTHLYEVQEIYFICSNLVNFHRVEMLWQLPCDTQLLTPMARVLVETVGKWGDTSTQFNMGRGGHNCLWLTQHREVSSSEHCLNSLAIGSIHPRMVEPHSIHKQLWERRESKREDGVGTTSSDNYIPLMHMQPQEFCNRPTVSILHHHNMSKLLHTNSTVLMYHTIQWLWWGRLHTSKFAISDRVSSLLQHGVMWKKKWGNKWWEEWGAMVHFPTSACVLSSS